MSFPRWALKNPVARLKKYINVLSYSNENFPSMRSHFSGFYSPTAGDFAGWEMSKCFSPELECSGGALTVLTSGFFSELFCLSCCCWPGLLKPCARGDVTSLQDRAVCPFFMSGDVIGKLKELGSRFCASRECLFEFDVCSFSRCLVPCDVCVLVEELGEAEKDPSLSARGLNVDDCSEPTDFLADETGIELLLESHLRPGDEDFKEETEDNLLFDVISSIFVLIGSG